MFPIGDNLVWTKYGLRRVREIERGYYILGIDRKGYPIWSEISSSPSLKTKHRELIHIILDRGEIIVAPSCKLCQRERVVQAAKIECGDKLEVLSDPKCILKELKKTPTNHLEEIKLGKYGAIPLTEETGYLLGILLQRTDVPALWSEGSMIIRVPRGNVDWAMRRLKEVIHDFSLTAVRDGHNWSFIEFRSDVTKLIPYLPRTEDIVANVLKSHYSILHSFVKGFIDMRSIVLEEHRRIVTTMEEIELRKLLYNVFFLYSVDCITTLGRHQRDQICYIEVSSSDLALFEKGKICARTLNAWTEVKGVYRIRGNMYAFPRSEKIYWSPVIDLVLLAA